MDLLNLEILSKKVLSVEHLVLVSLENTIEDELKICVYSGYEGKNEEYYAMVTYKKRFEDTEAAEKAFEYMIQNLVKTDYNLVDASRNLYAPWLRTALHIEKPMNPELDSYRKLSV